MRYISGIINLVIGLFILSLGIHGLSEYFEGTEKKIKKYESLLDVGAETLGVLDSVYTEIKIKGSSSYSSKYFFQVDDKEYSGKFNFDSPDDLSPVITVRYMPDDPSINDVNIEQQLEEARNEEGSSTNLIIGIGALLVSIYFLYFKGIRRFMQPKVEQTPTA